MPFPVAAARGRAFGAARPFTPAGIAGLFAHYRADAGLFQDTAGTVPAVADGDPVGLWQDQSGAGNHVTQSTSAKRPTLKLNVRNGMPVVRFAGSQWLQRSTFTGGAPSLPYTAVYLWQLGAQTYAMDAGPGVNEALVFIGNTSGGGAFNINRGSTQRCYPEYWGAPTPWFGGGVVWNGASTYTLRNGQVSSLATLNPGSLSCNGLTLGAANDGTGGVTGDFGEVLLYAGDTTGDPNWPSLWSSWLPGRWATPSLVALSTGGLNAFPATVKLANGQILVLFSKAATNDQSAPSDLYVVRSADNGKSWTARGSAVYGGDGSINTWGAGVQLASGTVLGMLTVQLSPSAALVGNYTLKSTDNGATWGGKTAITAPAGYDTTSFIVFGTLTELTPGGTLYATAYARNSVSGYYDSLLLQSADHGATWALKSVIMTGDATHGYTETAIANTGGSNWIAVGRLSSQNCYVATSTDNGATWTAPSALSAVNPGGISPNFCTLNSGKLLLSVGERGASPNLWGAGSRAVYTTDGGTTWSGGYGFFLDPNGGTSNGGYPSAVQAADGAIVEACYDHAGTLWAVRMRESELL